MEFRSDQPYDSLPLLPPQFDPETKQALKQCIRSVQALAELRQAGKLIPNQSALINALPLQEAKASSEIENIVTTNDELYKASVLERADDPFTKEVLRYRKALKFGCQRIRENRIDIDLIQELCTEIIGRPAELRSKTGTAVVDAGSRKVVYTPPCGKDLIRKKLENLIEYMNGNDDTEALIRLAVIHYQFEAIHPFFDGNGRTGRILNILFLTQQRLLDSPVLYLSGYIIQSKDRYYRLLRNVTENHAWDEWVMYILRGIEVTARRTTLKIHSIRDLTEEMCRECREMAPKLYSKELIELLFVQPYCRISDLVNAGIAARQTASVYLQKLADIGLLEPVKSGRQMLYLNPRFMELLAQF